MNLEEQKEVSKRLETLKLVAEYTFAVDLSKLELTFDLRGRSAGMAVGRGGLDPMLRIRLNQEAYDIDPDRMLTQTLPHELAHIVCYAMMYQGRLDRKAAVGHGKSWKTICVELGGKPDRCHTMALTPARKPTKQKRHVYKLDSGTMIELTTVRHNKVQRGKVKGYEIGHRRELLVANHYTGVSHV
jgi:predicted SprT family Zn-dependent metalloprotease